MPRSPRINVSLPVDLHARVQHAARMARRSDSDFIALIVEAHLREHPDIERAEAVHDPAHPLAAAGPTAPVIPKPYRRHQKTA